MVKTQSLAFSYDGKRKMVFPDFEAEPSAPMLILGLSGKGKTTLLHLLAGLLTPTEGSVWVGGVDIARLTARQLDQFRGQKIGLVLQRPHFVPSLSVMDNLRLAPWLASLPVQDERIRRMAERLNVGALLDRKPLSLSQGEQQRITILRALINRPEVILADEPTSALDDAHCMDVADMLTEEAAEVGACLVVVTHDGRLKDRISHHITL